jgi:DinB superfamily
MTRERLRHFEQVLAEAFPRLAQITDARSEEHLAPGKWSRKEILGHLIDSASNNHQRFVRARLLSEVSFPGYAQNQWVETQGYQSESWQNLVQLWAGFNRHILHFVSRIPEDSADNRCALDGNKPVTLRFLVDDYVRHLGHHLAQIL